MVSFLSPLILPNSPPMSQGLPSEVSPAILVRGCLMPDTPEMPSDQHIHRSPDMPPHLRGRRLACLHAPTGPPSPDQGAHDRSHRARSRPLASRIVPSPHLRPTSDAGASQDSPQPLPVQTTRPPP